MNSHDDDLSTFPIDMENLVDTSKDEMSEELMIKVYSDLHSNIEFFISEIWGANMYTIGGLWLEQAQQYLLPAMRQDPSVLERLGALYVVKRVVWVLALQHQLDQHIFDQTYPLGVTAEQEKLFDEAPQTTTGDAQGKVWRSDKIRELMASSEFQEQQFHAFTQVIEATSLGLDEYFPSPLSVSKDVYLYKDCFKNHIVYAAIRLHQAMLCTKNQYQLRRNPIPGNGDVRQIQDSFFFDVRTFRTINKSEDNAVAMVSIVPELVRMPDFGLTKAGYLVKVADVEPSEPTDSSPAVSDE